MKSMVKMIKNLSSMFNPKAVCVIGASRKPGKIGHEILKNLINYGFGGKIYPINPEAREILGLKAYPTVKSTPTKPDLAVVALPAVYVSEAIEECGRKGVKAVAVISSGFKEVGNARAEGQIVNLSKKYRMRLLGPNIFGVFYAPSKLNATFGPPNVLPGRIAFITQSGALGIALMGWTISEEVGLSAIVSLGNKSDVDDADLLEFFSQDPNTEVIVIYMEGINDGKEFMRVAKKTVMTKPIIVIKAGRSERGARAILSHTGALAGSDAVYDAAFKQCGVIRTSTTTEAFDLARLFAGQPLPDGDNTVIITNGGGMGIMAVDACKDSGVTLMDIPKDLAAKFRKNSGMPTFGSTVDPIDMTGQIYEAGYSGAIKTALSDPRVNSLIILYCQTAVTDPKMIARAIIKTLKENGAKKPVVTSLVGGEECRVGIRELNRAGIPSYSEPQRAVFVIGAMHEYARYLRKRKK